MVECELAFEGDGKESGGAGSSKVVAVQLVGRDQASDSHCCSWKSYALR